MNDQASPPPGPSAPDPARPLARIRQLSQRVRAFLPGQRRQAPDPATRPLATASRPGAPIRAFRPPLPLTSAVLVLVLVLPTLQLLRHPRPRAVGLEQLLAETSLLQSFPPTPERPLPPLWLERLGPAQAESLWRRQRGPWWQFWGEHAEAAPLLAFSASSLAGGPAAPLPANALRVGDLVVVAADPLSRQLLRDRLLPQQRLSRGLNRRCLERLRLDQAVLWNSTGLGVITGPVAPFLQRLSRGCLSFGLAGGGLIWQGEAGDGEGLLSPLPSSRVAAAEPLPPLPSDRLLELEGGSMDLVLQDLLSRPLIRDPLSRRYGLDAGRLSLLRRTPFRLQLRSLPRGPFQASLELQLPVGRQQQAWQALLDQLSRTLVQQGLSPVTATSPAPSATANPKPSGTDPSTTGPNASTTNRSGLPAASPAAPPTSGSSGVTSATPSSTRSPSSPGSSSAPAGGATWKRGDGVIVGGWRWIGSGRGSVQLLLFLGPVPAEPLLPIVAAESTLPGPGQLRLRSRPQALQALGLLPPDVPELVRRSEQLWMVAEPPAGINPATPLSFLSGGLRVRR